MYFILQKIVLFYDCPFKSTGFTSRSDQKDKLINKSIPNLTGHPVPSPVKPLCDHTCVIAVCAFSFRTTLIVKYTVCILTRLHLFLIYLYIVGLPLSVPETHPRIVACFLFLLMNDHDPNNSHHFVVVFTHYSYLHIIETSSAFTGI